MAKRNKTKTMVEQRHLYRQQTGRQHKERPLPANDEGDPYHTHLKALTKWAEKTSSENIRLQEEVNRLEWDNAVLRERNKRLKEQEVDYERLKRLEKVLKAFFELEEEGLQQAVKNSVTNNNFNGPVGQVIGNVENVEK